MSSASPAVVALRRKLREAGVPLTEFPVCPVCSAQVNPAQWDAHQQQHEGATP